MKILRYVFMAALLNGLIQIIQSQWQIIQKTWTFQVTEIIVLFGILWLFISWIKKEQSESEIKRRELTESELLNANNKIKKLQEENVNLKTENRGLRKGVFINQYIENTAAEEVFVEQLLSKGNSLSRCLIIILLESIKSILLGNEREYIKKIRGYGLNEDWIECAFLYSDVWQKGNENNILKEALIINSIINRIILKTNQNYIPAMLPDNLKIKSKEDKVAILDFLVIRAKLIPE